MRTKDIAGAQASTKGLGIFANVKRREDIKCSLNNADVIGANSGSLKKGPVTNRRTNPLLMDYKYPGAESLVDKHDPFSFHKKEASSVFQNNAAKVLGSTTNVADLKPAASEKSVPASAGAKEPSVHSRNEAPAKSVTVSNKSACGQAET